MHCWFSPTSVCPPMITFNSGKIPQLCLFSPERNSGFMGLPMQIHDFVKDKDLFIPRPISEDQRCLCCRIKMVEAGRKKRIHRHISPRTRLRGGTTVTEADQPSTQIMVFPALGSVETKS